MIKAIISDFSYVLLFPNNAAYRGSLNAKHQELSADDEGYDFFGTFLLNEELMDVYKSYSDKIPAYIYTSAYIQEHDPVKKKLDPVFKRILSAARMGNKKSKASSYGEVCREIGVETHEAVFIDDSPTNVEAAEQAGLHAIQHVSNEQSIKEIQKIISVG